MEPQKRHCEYQRKATTREKSLGPEFKERKEREDFEHKKHESKGGENLHEKQRSPGRQQKSCGRRKGHPGPQENVDCN